MCADVGVLSGLQGNSRSAFGGLLIASGCWERLKFGPHYTTGEVPKNLNVRLRPGWRELRAGSPLETISRKAGRRADFDVESRGRPFEAALSGFINRTTRPAEGRRPAYIPLLQGQSAIDQRYRVVDEQWVGVRAGNNGVRSRRTGLVCRGAVAGSNVVIILDACNRAAERREWLARRPRCIVGLDGQRRRVYRECAIGWSDHVIRGLVCWVNQRRNDWICSYGAGWIGGAGIGGRDIVAVFDANNRSREGRVGIAV